MNYTYDTRGTCSKKIKVEIDESTNKIVKVEFVGGCDGNTKGLAAVLEGMYIDEVIKRLKGIDCRNRGTSCPDQLALALEEIKSKNNQKIYG